MASSVDDETTNLGSPKNLIDFKNDLTSLLLTAWVEIAEFGHRSRYTQKEAARLAECGVQTVKDAIKDGRLKVGTSGWITRDNLTEWIGTDPIIYRSKLITALQKQVNEITAILDSLFLKKPQTT
jgi:hypothetical protein